MFKLQSGRFTLSVKPKAPEPDIVKIVEKEDEKPVFVKTFEPPVESTQVVDIPCYITPDEETT
jgi:hypothetical protein